MPISAGHLTYIINHVFLPLKLPHECDPESPLKDAVLAGYIAEVTQSFRNILKSTRDEKADTTWNILERMLLNVANLHKEEYLNKLDVETALENMRTDEVLPLYIACQNAVVIFRKLQGDYLTFECFEASLPNEDVMKLSKKIQVQYPASPRLLIAATHEVLSTLANLLAFFSSNPIEDALPKTKKGKDEHHETRNVASPRYISEAIAGIIRATQPSNGPAIQTTFVTKRLNDHVLWKSIDNPWRRSPLWLLIRVSLQTTLQERGSDDAWGYKAFLAFFMARILKDAVAVEKEPFTIDLLYFMNAKLGRRLIKMGRALRTAGDTVLVVSNILEGRWGEVIKQWEDRKQWTAPDPAAFEGCLTLTFPNSQSYLRKVVNRQQQLSMTLNSFDKPGTENRLRSACVSRPFYSSSTLPSSIDRKEISIALFDFESWVQQHLPKWIDSPSRSEQDFLPLYTITNEYWSAASSHYKDNPECLSLMFLCILELWVALDSLVCEWCELFQEYSPEIAANILDPLLLPYLEQVTRLHKVQDYIKQRHEQASRAGGLSIFHNPNSTQSFANRFYDLDQASDLRSLQARIEQWAAQRNAEKIQELNQKSSQYESKMKEYYSKSCSYSTKRNRYGDTYQAHDRWCYRCGCRDDAQRLRITPVEEPFPDSRGQTRAIVFELKCPQPVALWRDMVIKILQADSSGSQERESEIHPLSSYNPLSQFYTPPYPGSRISLASSAKSVAASHYGSPRSFPTSEGLVILQSAGRFKLYDSSKGRWIETMPHPNLRKQCTLRLEGSYVTLQEFHENTTHAPNQVLATQHRCPTDFSINEYIVFGHVRAGNRLQWRNILRALRAQSLSFSEPSVYFLIIQAIWQAGPMGDSGIYREAHADLEDESFCDQALGELEAVIQLVGDNWTQTLLLATAISLTLRIHHFAPTKQLQCRASEILKKSRQVAAGWISLLQAGHASQDQANNISRHVLVGISLTLRATYDVNPNNLTSIFSDEEDLTWYLYAGTFISDLVDGSLPKGIHFLAVRDRKMSLKCLPYVSSVCWTKPRLLHKVIERRWSSYRAGSEWHPLSSPADRWWSSWTKGGPKLTSRTVHLNILDGSFLIDGRTFDRLPSNYTSHHAYKTLFGYKEVEDIRPSTMNGMIYEGSYQGHEIHFSLIGNDLVIRRRHGEEIEEFIPSTTLSGDLPYGLIKDHHHWYMEDVKTLEVRPISQTWSRNAPRIWRVALGNNGLLLAGTAERQLMSGLSRLVNVHSWIYSHLSKALEPLEPRHDGILVTVDSDDSVTNPSVFIQRHDLTFHVTSSNLLECQSFPGFVLEPNYSGIGGLVGLQTIISLRKANSLYSERKIIVPKGDISSRIGLYGHPLTAINVSSAGGYFAYDIDELLGRLQGSRSVESDLFLIQLHAFTASPLADPLTRRSATSVALESLNTSSCFSNHRLSEEARSYLDTLASFTPIRAFYPKYLQVMETVQWNTSLPALSQHPSFLPLVESILDHWRSMDIFHSLGDLLDPIEVPTGMDHLTRRATARNWVYHVSAPASQPIEDSSYQRRDFINGVQSQERERRAFEIAHLANPTVTSFPLYTSLKQTVLAWQSVEKVDRWTWDNVEDWFSSAAVMKKIWCTLYALCKEASPHPTFSLIAALSLLRYRGAPVDILSTLMAVNRRIRASEHNFLVSSRLDFTQGSTFDREKLRQVLRGYSIGFERSEEYNIERRRNETGESRYRRGEALYEAEISRQINHTISELENQWPDPPNRLSITTRRLLDLDDESKSRLHGILLEWSRNRAFLNHIDQISNALRPFYSSSTNSDLYRPDVKLNRIQPRSFTSLGLNELMDSIQPPPSTQNTSPKLPDEVSSQSTNTVASDELEDLFSQLESSVHRELEALYLENLQKSITALTEAEPSFDNHTTAPSSERLSNFQRQTRKIAKAEFLSLKDSLTPRNHLSTLRSAVGLLPTITPMVLLRRLSLLNRQEISESWKNRLLQYATTVQDAKWGDRMLRLLLAGRIHHLLLEARNRREWKPYEHPDWLLIEIDADLSIRPQQADMAKEMIDPPSGLNSVMQLNMGEGKSSVIVPIVCVSAIDRSHALSRVVVLRSQLRQQFHILRQTITNLCDRQVFYLPFTRNIEIDEQSAQRILQFLNNAASSGAVWLCEPEQLLSLKLLGLDKSLRGQPEDPLGRHIIAIQSWIHQNTHDTIDESDEIFQTKQQVIYTVGSQKSLEAAPWRWELTEKLLDLLAQYLSQCKENESDSFTMEDPKATGDHPEIKAVLYFEDDELMVMTPDGLAQPLMDSPYCERLDQCLVYLDDAHTRGTDLRLPDVHAVVTLGPKLVKDKLVQGCMRMRKLGHGQSVTFLASSEVIPFIREATKPSAEVIDSKAVLIWTIKETWKQLQANLPAYMLQGHSFVRREEAWKQFEDSKFSHRQLAENLCEQESRTLRELYGPDAANEHAWMRNYHSPNADSEISRAIFDRCKDLELSPMTDANLNEEKEVELEHEKEIERVVEWPEPVKAAKHQLERDIKLFIATGTIPNQSTVFLKVDRALLHTSAPIPQGLSNVVIAHQETFMSALGVRRPTERPRAHTTGEASLIRYEEQPQPQNQYNERYYQAQIAHLQMSLVREHALFVRVTIGFSVLVAIMFIFIFFLLRRPANCDHVGHRFNIPIFSPWTASVSMKGKAI
ncbi:hypothetical protein CPB86DRAFT_800493 [Serendipita vermifera]|nr:hypothetical protein CPB86DRAFT_800493 [Serendipita vermifera]